MTEFRAGVIVGPGSISFEMIRFMTELFPLIPGPPWIGNSSQPIAAQNVLDYLTDALTNSAGQGQVFEIGGPQVMKYSALMLEYARLRGLKRRMLTFPYIPLWFMAFGVGLTTPVPRRIAYALIDGLRSDSRVQEPSALQAFPDVALVPYDAAVRASLAALHPDSLQPVWKESRNPSVSIRHEGFFISHRTLHVNAPPEKVFEVITRLGQAGDWLYANGLWNLRRHVDSLFQKRELRGIPVAAGAIPQVGERMDFYTVEAVKSGSRLLLRSLLKAPGEGWMEWNMEPDEGGDPLDPDGLLHAARPARIPLLVFVISGSRAGVPRADPRHRPPRCGLTVMGTIERGWSMIRGVAALRPYA